MMIDGDREAILSRW